MLAMGVSGIAALSVAQTAQKHAFEVVSIKRNTSGQGGGAITTAGGRFGAKDAKERQGLQFEFFGGRESHQIMPANPPTKPTKARE